MAHAHDALVLVDNSIMSPVVSQPLELGAGSNIKHELYILQITLFYFLYKTVGF